MKSSRKIEILLTQTFLVAYLKTLSVLELLYNFSNLSTVAYKAVAYKKNRVVGKKYWSVKLWPVDKTSYHSSLPITLFLPCPSLINHFNHCFSQWLALFYHASLSSDPAEAPGMGSELFEQHIN